MRRTAKWILRGGLIIVALLLAVLIQVWFFKPFTIQAFYARVFAQFALESPELLSSMRILPPWLDFYGADLDDASPAHDERVAQMSAHNHDVLLRYDRESMDTEGKLSYDVLEYFLRMQVEGDRFRLHNPPVNQMSGTQIQLPNFMAQVHQVTNAKEAKQYVQRLRKFPRKFSQVIESLKLSEAKGILPQQFEIEEVQKQMEDFIAKPSAEHLLYVSFKEKLDKIPAGEMDASTRQGFLTDVAAAIDQAVYPAYRDLLAYWKTLQPKAQGNYGAWHLPDGGAYYAWCVRNHTTTDLSPEQLHATGLAEVERISSQMEAILRGQGLAEGTIGARVQQLSRQPQNSFPNTPDGKAAMLVRYQEILDEVNRGLSGAFDVRPKLGVTVKPVPAFAEKTSSGAYYEAGAFDGSRPGVFYANMRDTAETPKFAMRTLAYHEGIPGHHFQISIMQELKGVPFFRRVLPFTAFIEGWALYAERLAWELGFEKDPLDDLGRLRDEMLRAVRLVVDTGIHSQHWTREQSITYMVENTGMLESDVTAEIERYFVNPGQALAYKTGMLKILQLREKAKASLGERFDLKKFHDEVLTHGALPLVLLERVIDDWIAKTGPSGPA